MLVHDIVLHDALWQRLQEQRSRLPHALLFVGQAGIGKLALATQFVASLLCEAPLDSGSACGTCAACNWLGQGNHPDFRRLRPTADDEVSGEEGDKSEKSDATRVSREITIDQVRALDDFMHVGTHRRGLRVILIEPAEAMNRTTANALLKTLEEPGPGTVFLLVSHAPDRLLPTIRSRCQVVAIAKPANELALRWLAERGVDQPDHWLALAGGAPCLPEELARGVPGTLLDTLVTALGQGPQLDAVDTAGQIDKLIRANRREPGLRQAVDWTQRWSLDLALRLAGQEVRYFRRHSARIGSLGQQVDKIKLFHFNRKSVDFKKLSEHTLNNRLFLEDLLTDYTAIFG